jgi:hypothetical protein
MALLLGERKQWKEMLLEEKYGSVHTISRGNTAKQSVLINHLASFRKQYTRAIKNPLSILNH